jgi:hypothetical protein
MLRRGGGAGAFKRSAGECALGESTRCCLVFIDVVVCHRVIVEGGPHWGLGRRLPALGLTDRARVPCVGVS